MPGWSSSCGASLRVIVSISRRLAFLGGDLQDAAGDRAQREQAAAEFWITSMVRSGCCETFQQPCGCQRPQLAA